MKKKSLEQKKLEGTARKDRDYSGDSLEILDKVKSPGKHFSNAMNDRAQKIYFALCEKLLPTKKLTEVDLPNVVQLANAWDKYIWAEQAMMEKNQVAMGSGYVQVFKTGATNITTEMSISEKAQDQIIKLSKMFGFSFKDRHAMASFLGEGDPNQTDLWGQLMGTGNSANNLKVVGED